MNNPIQPKPPIKLETAQIEQIMKMMNDCKNCKEKNIIKKN